MFLAFRKGIFHTLTDDALDAGAAETFRFQCKHPQINLVKVLQAAFCDVDFENLLPFFDIWQTNIKNIVKASFPEQLRRHLRDVIRCRYNEHGALVLLQPCEERAEQTDDNITARSGIPEA